MRKPGTVESDTSNWRRALLAAAGLGAVAAAAGFAVSFYTARRQIAEFSAEQFEDVRGESPPKSTGGFEPPEVLPEPESDPGFLLLPEAE